MASATPSGSLPRHPTSSYRHLEPRVPRSLRWLTSLAGTAAGIAGGLAFYAPTVQPAAGELISELVPDGAHVRVYESSSAERPSFFRGERWAHFEVEGTTQRAIVEAGSAHGWRADETDGNGWVSAGRHEASATIFNQSKTSAIRVSVHSRDTRAGGIATAGVAGAIGFFVGYLTPAIMRGLQQKSPSGRAIS